MIKNCFFITIILCFLFICNQSLFCQKRGTVSLYLSSWHVENDQYKDINPKVFDINTIHNELNQLDYYRVYFKYKLPYNYVFGTSSDYYAILYEIQNIEGEIYYNPIDIFEASKELKFEKDDEWFWSSFIVPKGDKFIISVYHEGWLLEESNTFKVINSKK